MNFHKPSIILFFTLFAWSLVQAQDLTQTIRGRIVDSESKFPLIGANIVLKAIR